MVVLINPNLVVQRNDPFTTGIVYMPVGLAYVAASFLAAGIPVKVVDAFAERPYETRHDNKFMFLGLDHSEIAIRIPADTAAIFVYAINLTNHLSTIGIVKALKQSHPGIPVVVLENTQAVTAYSLRFAADEFYEAGADYILTGEAEQRSVRFFRMLTQEGANGRLQEIDGLGCRAGYNAPSAWIEDLDSLPFPAWDLFPLENYWRLKFAHGPQSTARYLPLLTSRGCPYACAFCATPAVNDRKWRCRSAQNVVNEIEHFSRKYGVNEFHIEDLNPTVSDRRIREICHEILNRHLRVVWKLAAGTKAETIMNEDTIDLMARAGCRYISISPETGSPRMLRMMNKPFDLEHAVRLIGRMNKVGIRSQACFVLGYPGETADDLKMTWDTVHDLTVKGADEIALFIITPVPGSAIYDGFKGFDALSELNFSPTWRSDYRALNSFRLSLYKHFLFWKLLNHPLKVLRQALNFARRRFETKMEMVPYRALVFRLLDGKCRNASV